MRVGKPSPTRMVNQFRTHVHLSDISLIVVKYGAYHGMKIQLKKKITFYWRILKRLRFYPKGLFSRVVTAVDIRKICTL